MLHLIKKRPGANMPATTIELDLDYVLSTETAISVADFKTELCASAERELLATDVEAFDGSMRPTFIGSDPMFFLKAPDSKAVKYLNSGSNNCTAGIITSHEAESQDTIHACVFLVSILTYVHSQ